MLKRKLLNYLIPQPSPTMLPTGAEAPLEAVLGAKRSRNSQLHRDALLAKSRRRARQPPYEFFL